MTTWESNPWREIATGSLQRELECRRWELADIDAHPEGWQFAPESRIFLLHTIREINGELSKRRRLADRPNAPAFPDQPVDRRAELDEIKRRVQLIDLINREVFRVYERRGRTDVWCCCPLPGHQEDSPSFHIDEARGVWHCFGCKQGGGLFELARHLWGIGEFAKVVERLKDVAGMTPLPTVPPGATRPDGHHTAIRVASPRSRTYGRR